MFGIKTFLAGMAIGGVGTLFTMQYHLVRTNEGVIVVARDHQPPLKSIYVDVRKWSVAMWAYYPEVSAALLKAGRSDVLLEGAVRSLIPDQADAGRNPAPATKSDSASEKTQQAIEALIPIRYTHPPEALADARTAHPPAPSRPLPLADRASTASNSLTGAAIPQASGGLPTLDHPVPLPSHPATARPVSVDSGNAAPAAGPEWMRGFLRSLIPKPAEDAARTPAPSGRAVSRAIPQPAPPAPSTGRPTPAWEQWGIGSDRTGEAIPPASR